MRASSRWRWTLGAMAADQGLSVGLCQPFGLLAASEPSQHLFLDLVNLSKGQIA